MKKYKFKTSFTFDGKRYQIYADTEKELIRKSERRKMELEQGQTVVSSNMKLASWYDIYLETYKVNCKEITLKNWKYKIEKQLISRLGQMPLQTIKPIHCQKILNDLDGYSADYIRKIKQSMSAIFDKAVENRLILENPARYLVMPRGTKTTRRSVTDEERAYILEAVNLEYRYKFFEVMLYCGLRPSEVADLKGEDIKDGMILVRGTKTKSAHRKVPIPLHLSSELNLTSGEYVFKNRAGKKFDETGRRNLWKSFKRQLNIIAGCKVYRNELVPPYPIPGDLVPYCLRHTFCTDLAKAGVDIRIAQRLMGHASITTTANIYTHIGDDDLREAAVALENYRNATQPPTYPKVSDDDLKEAAYKLENYRCAGWVTP